MEFPIGLRNAIEEKVIGLKQENLKKTAQTISERYKNQSGDGKKLVATETEALVYSLVRMPATFGAVADAIQYAVSRSQLQIDSLLDAGAGSGAASWAADYCLELQSITCLEREMEMQKIGQELMKEGSDILKNTRWITTDLVRDPLDYKADLIISSYVMNEMKEEDRMKVVKKLWEAAQKMLLIIEPGTPVGYKQLMNTRDLLISYGAHIAAPCTHKAACRLAKEDWCHFTTRIQRSKMHKLLKDGEVPYEDEKYIYMAFTREACTPASARILRHPVIEKGQVTLEICTEREIKKVTIKKNDKEHFKAARKSKCGDEIDLAR